MALTKEQIAENKQLFINLVKEITVEDANIEGLISFLENSDFFTAPASTLYHSGFEGGLCLHSLNVYRNLCTLAEIYAPGVYHRDSLLVVALFHDISKVNFYEKTVKNQKVYCPDGKQYDSMGNYKWVSVESFKVIDASLRYLSGDHGFNSFMLISRFLPLSQEEVTAIVNHHCGMDNGFVNRDLSAILNRYPLATLLHLADMLSVYIDERIPDSPGIL